MQPGMQYVSSPVTKSTGRPILILDEYYHSDVADDTHQRHTPEKRSVASDLVPLCTCSLCYRL